MVRYDLTILGATAAAMGIAQAVKETKKVLILNETEMVAYEFVNTFCMPGVYSQGAAYYKKFRELGVDLLLKTDILSITAQSGEYRIEVFHCGGFQTIETKAVVDTTTDSLPLVKKSLNGLLVSLSGADCPEPVREGVEFVADSKGAYSTVILKYDCPVECSMREARHQLIDFWKNREAGYSNWKIAAIGFCFEEKPSFRLSQKGEGYLMFPSAWYGSPSESFEAGAALGRGLSF